MFAQGDVAPASAEDVTGFYSGLETCKIELWKSPETIAEETVHAANVETGVVGSFGNQFVGLQIRTGR